MFRHKKEKTKTEKQTNIVDDDVKKIKKDKKEPKEETVKELKEEVSEEKFSARSTDSTKELLEKNLKWSQIIYEQNRKINRKLAWAAVASWFRLLIILIPLILALVFLPPVAKQVWSQYSSLNSLIGNSGTTSTVQSPNKLESLMKILNLSSEQIDQVKNLTK